MKGLSLFCLLIGFSLSSLNAQNVMINEDFPIGQMMDRFVEKNKSTGEMEGWRIQIMATTDRSKVETAKRDFLQKYADINIDWTHSKPYYRLRAGAFATKLDAIRLLQTLKKDYPSAYLVKDNKISPRELLQS